MNIPTPTEIQAAAKESVRARRQKTGGAYSDPKARFFERVDKTDTCWLWAGATDNHGYGLFRIKDPTWKRVRAHRYSWFIHHGVIPGSLFVCHRCDVPLCVRPDHLFLGTHTDNMRDAAAKGRLNPQGFKARTHCKKGHLYEHKKGRHVCRVCINNRRREWRSMQRY